MQEIRRACKKTRRPASFKLFVSVVDIISASVLNSRNRFVGDGTTAFL